MARVSGLWVMEKLKYVEEAMDIFSWYKWEGRCISLMSVWAVSW